MSVILKHGSKHGILHSIGFQKSLLHCKNEYALSNKKIWATDYKQFY